MFAIDRLMGEDGSVLYRVRGEIFFASVDRFTLAFGAEAGRDVVQIVWDDFLETAIEIAENHGEKKSRNIGRHCSWCDYEGPCRAEMQGSDFQFLIDREYVKEGEEDHGDENSED